MSQPVMTFRTERVDDVRGDDVILMGAAPAAPGAFCLNRLPIRLNYAIRLLDIGDIVAATASNKRVEVMTVEATYPTYYTLSELEQRLPSDRFLRVHDGWIVNLAQITEIHCRNFALIYSVNPSIGLKLHQLQHRLSTRAFSLSQEQQNLYDCLLQSN